MQYNLLERNDESNSALNNLAEEYAIHGKGFNKHIRYPVSNSLRASKLTSK